MEPLHSNRRHLILLGVAVLAVALYGWLPWFDAPGSEFDEAITLVYPELFLRGQVVHRDFQSFYGPGNLWLLGAFYQVLGISVEVERLVGFLVRTGYLFLLGALALRVAPRTAPAVVLIGWVALLPFGLMALAWFPAVVLFMTALLLAASGGGRTFVSGMLAGWALVFRPDMGPAVLLGFAVYFVLWKRSGRLRWLGGFAAGLVPLLIHAAVAGPEALWRNFFYDPVVLGRGGRTIPWDQVAPDLHPLLWLHAASAVGSVAVGWRLWRKNSGDGTGALLLAMGLGVAGLSYQMIQRCDLAHVFMGTLLTLPLGAVTWQRGMQFGPERKSRGLAVVGAAGYMGLVALALPPVVWKGIGRTLCAPLRLDPTVDNRVVCGERSYPLAPEAARFHATRVAGFVLKHSRPGETLFVGPRDLRRTCYNDVYFYHLLLPKLRPSGYFIELNPLLASAPDSGLDRQLADTDWVILNAIYDRFQEKNRSVEYGSSRPGRVLAELFVQVGESGPFTIWRRKALRPAVPAG